MTARRFDLEVGDGPLRKAGQLLARRVGQRRRDGEGPRPAARLERARTDDPAATVELAAGEAGLVWKGQGQQRVELGLEGGRRSAGPFAEMFTAMILGESEVKLELYRQVNRFIHGNNIR